MGPYLAIFAAQFQLTLQYRAAALAGFVTQCWWGGLKIMVLSAFFAVGASRASITLEQLVSYIWLGQGLLALQPWAGDPAVGAGVRTGSLSLERLRPLDGYAYWYARSAATLTSRAVPRAMLMIGFAGLLLPVLGMGRWALLPPIEGGMFLASLLFVVGLSVSIVMLINVIIVATMSDRGANTIVAPIVILFSGSEIPLPLLPDWMQRFLFVQPFAGLVDIPFRIYTGHLSGAAAWCGLALQAFWTLTLVLAGRILLARVMRRLEVQGG